MPLDYDDLETDNADGEKKVFEGESSVDLDYKSNIELAKDALNLYINEDKMLQEKTQEELESLMAKISLTEDIKKSKNSEDEGEIISRAPTGGVPVSFVADCNKFICNPFMLDSKTKRSYNESEFHAVKYKKPTEHTDSVLQIQCSKIAEFVNQNVLQNTHQTSGGIMTINPSPSTASSEEYDSSFSPGESISDSLPEDGQVVSPFSDYSSLASPDNNDTSFREVSFDHLIKKETPNEDCQFDETKLKDVCEIIEKELNRSRIKEEKERLEKVLCDNSFSASSPPQHVPQQGSMPSSSPPSLYNPELNDILGSLLKSDITLPSQFFSQQPPITTLAQPRQPILVNSNHHQFMQQQQQQQPPPQAQTSSHIPYSLQPQQANVLSKTPTQQQYPVQHISTTGNQHQYAVPDPHVYNHPQQPVQSSSLLGYNQQNQQSANSTVSNQHFTSQQQTQMIQSSTPYPVALQPVASSQQHFPHTQQTQVANQTHYAVQPQQQSQIITSTSNQHYTLPQHQSLATPKQQFANSSHQQLVTASQSHVTGCAIQPTQPAIQQLTPVLHNRSSNPSMVASKNSGLPVTTASDQDGNATPATSSNNAVIILAQPANSPNSIMLVPTTNSQVLFIPQIPVTTKNKAMRSTPRVILPKPANSDPNGNQVDLKKLSAQTGRVRREKEKSSQPSESPGQGNLSVARRCVAGMREDELENTDQEGDNYLHVAVCRTDVYMVEALLERLKRSSKLDMINRQNHAQQTPVYLAVSANQPAMVHKLIRYGADANIKGMMQGYQHERVERAPIHCAASQGKEYYDTLKELFTSPVIDPDILNSDGLSALHCAIIEHGKFPYQKFQMTKIDNCQNVALLLKNKANPNLQDRCSGKTPLMYAIETKDYSMVDTILKGVESSKIPDLLTTKTFDGRNCLKIADGLRNEYDHPTWRKLHNFLSNVN